jgi:hypothetical protein
VLEHDAARVLMSQLIKLESNLFAKQSEQVLRHINEAGELEDASLGILATDLSTTPMRPRERAGTTR